MRLKIILLVLVNFTVFQSCNKPKEILNSDPSLYIDYLESYTTGLISTKDPIQVGLKFSPENWEQNQVIEDKLFTVSPKTYGKVVYLGNNLLSFIPDNILDHNQKYEVTFHLSKIIDVPENLQDFKFTIQTTNQDFIVKTLDLQPIGEDFYFLNGTISSSDWMTTEQAKELISVKTKNSKTKVKVIEKEKESMLFNFVVDSISRDLKETELEIYWDGTSQKINNKGNSKITIPAKNTFVIVSSMVNDPDNKSFWINFSDQIKRNQNLDGLISIKHKGNLKFSIDGSLIKVFSDTYFDGEIPITIFQGLENVNGKKTTEDKTISLSFEQQKPEVRLAKNGTILPSSENLKVNFQSINLKAVDVKIYRIYENNVLQFLQENNINQSDYGLTKVATPIAKKKIDLTSTDFSSLKKWGTYALDISTLITPEPGAIYHVKISFKKSYSLYNCPDNIEEPNTNSVDEDDEDDDEYRHYYYYDDYIWGEKDDPCSNSYYYYREIEFNVLASDLGVIAKKGGDNTYFFAVNNIVTTEPVSNASIDIYNYQQQIISSTKTNSEGLANITLDKKGYFAVVKKGKNTTYLKLNEGNSLSISNYDVDGVSSQKGLKAYIYTERGVWRPGDNIYVGFVLNDESNELPNNHPIKIELSDPYGKLIQQKVQTKNKDNHYSFELSTVENAPTGNWEAVVSVGGAKFYKQIKVETIKPNRLKIKNDLKDKLITSEGIKANFNAAWLQGAIAKNLKAEVLAKFISQETKFKGYDNYTFDNNYSYKSVIEQNIFSGKTDDNGDFSFFINPLKDVEDSGMMKMVIISTVHEKGGDFSTDVSSTTYSPYPTYVGISSPKGNKYNMLDTDTKNTFSIVSLSEKGNANAKAKIKIDVYKLNHNWWWDSSENNVSNYSSSTNSKEYYNTELETNNKGISTFDLTIPEADWGRYRIIATDLSSGHTSSKDVYIDWPLWSGKTKQGSSEAIALSIYTDKKEYNIKEKALISFPSSEGGRALISIENDRKVLETHWVKTKKGETIFELPIHEKMTPNVYINISMLQPHASTVNDSPIRMYGIVPILVNNKETKLQPIIKINETLKPEQKVQIEIKEATGKEMTYTIAVVEDGLLDLTRFRTPNPWDSFYSKTSLGVKTWDVYNDVIGAFGGKINQVLSIGGDEDLGGGNARKANRFKPVVIHLGPYKLNKKQKTTHEIQLPNYIGSVRTMVVASDSKNNAYGSAEKTSTVKSPLMILGSLPRKAVPTEKITLPVTVFAMEKQIKDVQVSIKVDNKFKIVGNSKQSLQFSEPDEKVAYFELEVGNTTGITKVQIEATSGKEKATYEVEMDVLNPNPISFKTKDIVLEANKSGSFNWESFGVAKSNNALLEISTFPAINLNSRLNYLIAYPHGCSEQITSSAFPQLYLSDFIDLTKEQKDNVQRNITAAIHRLSFNQLSDGGFTYWSDGGYIDDWATSYIGHFYIEAEKKGFILPVKSKSNWLKYQSKAAKKWVYAPSYRNDIEQSYRLYTLALAGSPDLAAMNRLRETKGISNDSKLRLAITYALAGQKNAAKTLLNSSNLDGLNNSYYYGSLERNLAMALETYQTIGDKENAHKLAIEVANNLSSNKWMSTQTTAYSLYAMSKYATENLNNVKDSNINLETVYQGKTEITKTKKGFTLKNLINVSDKNNSINFKNNSDGRVYIRVVYSGILPIGDDLIQQNGLLLSSVFKDTEGKEISPASIAQGTEFISEITIKNTTLRGINNIALTQIIPSGWEIVNLRFTDYGESSNKVDHTDIRDDRTNLYFSLLSNETKTFKIKLNASYLGNYYMPGIQAEAMYDNNYSSRNKGMWVKVVN